MNKFITLCMSFLLCITLVGCAQSNQSSNQKDSSSIINNLQPTVSWDDTGLFLSFTFDDMYFNIIFNEDNPQQYFAQHALTANQIKTIQIYPQQDQSQEFIYMVFKDNKFQIDEQDRLNDNNQGWESAYQKYQKKISNLNINTEEIGKFIVFYFNEHTRQELISDLNNQKIQLVKDIQKKGYTYEKQDDGRIFITKNMSRYKMVIAASECMIVNKDMDLSGGTKTGYMYTPKQGTVSYIVNNETKVVYRYKDDVYLKGTSTMKQFTEFQEIKKWYDTFLTELNTDIEILESL